MDKHPSNNIPSNKHNTESNLATLPTTGFYRAQHCAALLGISKSTFWLWAQQKTVQGVLVPQPIKLSAGVTVWKRSDIHAFCEQLAALGDSTPPPEAA